MSPNIFGKPFLWLLIAVAAVGIVTVVGWTRAIRQAQYTASPTPIPQKRIAVTIYPLYDLVRNIAGPDRVTLLVPPGADPTNSTRADLTSLSQAGMVFMAGQGIDDWIVPLATQAGIVSVVSLDQFLSQPDDRYWLSLHNAARIVQQVADSLGNTPEQQARVKSYEQLLKGLTTYGQTLASRSAVAEFAVSPKTWSSFADEWHLKPAKHPEFIEVQYASSSSLIAIDPFGGSIDKDTYLSLMKANLEIIFKE